MYVEGCMAGAGTGERGGRWKGAATGRSNGSGEIPLTEGPCSMVEVGVVRTEPEVVGEASPQIRLR